MGVADQDQRDRAIEHVLRHGLGRAATPSSPAACVDGETLAAWSSGALPQADAARIEEHLADCARCQSMLAAFARTEPVAAVPAPFWKGRRVRWLVPLAAAAVVAAIWVNVPQRNATAPSIADSRQAVPLESPAARSEAPPPAPPAAANEAPARLRDQTASTPPPQSAPPPREADATAKKKEEAFAGRERAAEENQAQDRLARVAPSAPSAPSALSAPSARSTPPTATAPVPLAEAVTIAPESRRLLAKAAGEFESPGGATRWRIVNGQVQRSTTEGKSWESIALPSAATLTAGHSPAPSVVWVVGRGGAIFLTTDGTRFDRIAFPHAVDLASILAVDDRQATVVTTDGRVFGTSDRGARWIQP